MSAFKKGDIVKAKIVIPQGPIVKMRMDEDGLIEYLVEWSDGSGVVHQRWYTADQIEHGA